MQKIDRNLMATNLKITSILILCVSACLAIPKIADARVNFHNLVANALTNTENSSFTSSNGNFQELTDVYVPPNYGLPDSQHGSGTR
ncbi:MULTISPECIES: hypothetical protein [Nostocaceae]|uniref:hypothetical protein n=1 Tax=Nostocaceae TaxID=1162 RepID=UPI001F54962D|nr:MULTISPECIES: hypothetical protein [Nostocaceae]